MNKHAGYRFARTVRCAVVVATALLAAVAGTTTAVSANFPHFKSFNVSLSGSTATATTAAKAAAAASSAQLPDLLYTWTEVGVGNPDVSYRLSTVVSATYGCVNNGSNRPPAENKRTVTAPLEAEATLVADRNGKVTGSVVVDTASVGTGGFSCPPGQTLVALSATFAQNTITDLTNGVTATDDDIVVTLWP